MSKETYRPIAGVDTFDLPYTDGARGGGGITVGHEFNDGYRGGFFEIRTKV